MKMLMIICPKARQDEITKLIESKGVHAFSEITEIIGEGQTGKKLGTLGHGHVGVADRVQEGCFLERDIVLSYV